MCTRLFGRLDAQEDECTVCVCTGLNIRQSREFSLINGYAIPDEKEISTSFNLLKPVLLSMVKESCEYWCSKMPDDAAISIDGSWDHRRHGHYEIFDVICIQLRKIIDFDIRINSSARIHGNTYATASAMKGESFIDIIDRLKHNPKIVELVKDGDVQIDKIIDDSTWDVHITPDPNHLTKHLPDHVKKIVGDLSPKFYGLHKYMHEKLVHIMYGEPDVDIRLHKLD